MAEKSKKFKKRILDNSIDKIKSGVVTIFSNYLFLLKRVESIVKCNVYNRNFNFDLLQRKDKENKISVKKMKKVPKNLKITVNKVVKQQFTFLPDANAKKK